MNRIASSIDHHRRPVIISLFNAPSLWQFGRALEGSSEVNFPYYQRAPYQLRNGDVLFTRAYIKAPARSFIPSRTSYTGAYGRSETSEFSNSKHHFWRMLCGLLKSSVLEGDRLLFI